MKLAGSLLLCACLFGQVATEANKSLRDAERRAQLAAGLLAESRHSKQRPKELIAALGLKPGMTVADVGTGSGYMLPFLADAVGPTGKVYAEDIFPDMLVAAKKHAANYSNITYVLGNEKSAALPSNTFDVILVLDTFHHFDYPADMMANLHRAIKPGGRVVVVEYHKSEKAMPDGFALQHVRGTRDEFVREIEGYGFRTESVSEFTPDVQWIGVFVRR